MRHLFLVLVQTIIIINGYSQVKSKTCLNGYSNSDSLELYNNIDFITHACNWATCHGGVQTIVLIDNKVDSTLMDFSTHNSLITTTRTITFKVSFNNSVNDSLLKADTSTYLTGILIANGNRESPTNFLKYQRPKTIKVTINGNYWGEILLSDTPKTQYVDFNNRYLISKEQIIIKFEIVDLYRGSEPEYSISEIQFDGLGGHSITHKVCK
ncbi:hypothetical protein OAH12_01840 [Cyclobacteriaceae bacterium]|nr:hypothetical protein [Cyclobacteriaceae bacterium]